MKRIIKLIILVFVVAGIIVGIMFLPSIVSIIKNFGGGSSAGGSIYAGLAKDIEHRWEQCLKRRNPVSRNGHIRSLYPSPCHN